MRIPLMDLRPGHRELETALLRRARGVLRSGDFILGRELARFETEFARYIEVPHAIGVSCGLDALKLALAALGVGPGDEVIVPAMTFVATALAVSHIGARPVFADVEEETPNLDASALGEVIGPRTRAIIAVHLYGQPADLGPILRAARRHGLPVIEDAAQAHGARYRGRRVGGIGTAGCFSFYPGKNLGALGDGGMVVTRDAALADRLRVLRHCGQSAPYRSDVVGYNARLDTIQAAFLRVKLRRLEAWNRARARVARRYRGAFAGLPVRLPAERPGDVHVHHLFVIRTDRRDALRDHLGRRGIESRVYYPIPVPSQPCYRDRGRYPRAEMWARTSLALPMHPHLRPAQVERVIRAVRSFFAGR